MGDETNVTVKSQGGGGGGDVATLSRLEAFVQNYTCYCSLRPVARLDGVESGKLRVQVQRVVAVSQHLHPKDTKQGLAAIRRREYSQSLKDR